MRLGIFTWYLVVSVPRHLCGTLIRFAWCRGRVAAPLVFASDNPEVNKTSPRLRCRGLKRQCACFHAGWTLHGILIGLFENIWMLLGFFLLFVINSNNMPIFLSCCVKSHPVMARINDLTPVQCDGARRSMLFTSVFRGSNVMADRRMYVCRALKGNLWNDALFHVGHGTPTADRKQRRSSFPCKHW